MKPSSPGTTNAGRHPHRKKIPNTMKVATAPPMDDPLSNSAVANPRSCFGNHSETALVAAGQFADSAAPKRKRNDKKLRKPFARGVRRETSEYEMTVIVSPRLVPIRSISLPNTVCPTEYATRKEITILA